jgi:hypothetical protein
MVQVLCAFVRTHAARRPVAWSGGRDGHSGAQVWGPAAAG